MNKYIELDDVIKNEMKSIEFAKHFERELLINKIANMVYLLRSAAELTQKELADKVETTQPVIARLENGRDSRMPSIELLAKIATATGNELNISWHSQAA